MEKQNDFWSLQSPNQILSNGKIGQIILNKVGISFSSELIGRKKSDWTLSKFPLEQFKKGTSQ